MSHVIVAGVGMTRFQKTGIHQPYRVMTSNAINLAVKEAGIALSQIQQAYTAYIYGDSTSGQHAF